MKKIPVYASLLVLLVGIYYFYHYSPTQRDALIVSYNVFETKVEIPTRIGGARWLGNMVKGIGIFLWGYCPIKQQLGDCASESSKLKVSVSPLTSSNSHIHL